MEEANIKIDEYLVEQLEREDVMDEKEETNPGQERNESEGMDPMERGSEKAEDVSAPTDLDDEDITLGEFFNKRRRASEDFGDFGEELRKKGRI